MATRGKRKVVTGKVVSDKMNKTISVRVDRLVKHPLYGKYVKRWTVYKAHDEQNDAHEGDTVEIMETRPLSKSKRWRLVQIVERNPHGIAPAQATIGE